MEHGKSQGTNLPGRRFTVLYASNSLRSKHPAGAPLVWRRPGGAFYVPSNTEPALSPETGTGFPGGAFHDFICNKTCAGQSPGALSPPRFACFFRRELSQKIHTGRAKMWYHQIKRTPRQSAGRGAAQVPKRRARSSRAQKPAGRRAGPLGAGGPAPKTRPQPFKKGGTNHANHPDRG